MSVNILSPKGRLVQGDCFTPQTKDAQGAPLTIKTGPNAGQPTQRYFMAIAIPKNDPKWPAFHAQLDTAARASWPQLFPNGGQCTHPRFAWKIMDGDGIDDNGRSNASKEGFAGCWVVKFSSTFPPKCFRAGQYDPMQQLTNPMDIQRGYYVRIAGTADGNGNQQKPGIYVNGSMVELVETGPVITVGPDAASVFGADPVAPAAPVAMPPAPGYAPSTPVATPAPVPVTPNPAFLAPPPAAVPPPAGPVLIGEAAANRWTYEQLRTAGYDDAAMRVKGWLA